MNNKLISGLREETTKTFTENGMATFTTSLSGCIDLFFMGGASRTKSEEEIVKLFIKAVVENQDVALKTLAYIRDVRGGMGERRFFKLVLGYLAGNKIPFNVTAIPEFGRWDDLFVLIKNPRYTKEIVGFIKDELSNENGLCAKWMPRKGDVARLLTKELGLTPKQYRQLIVNLTKVVETQMCDKDWGDINYSSVPSVANTRYNKAFFRNDESRRTQFLDKAVTGDVKINSGVAFPHQILYGTGVKGDWKTATAMWNQFPDMIGESGVRFLPVCDVSGSMTGTPMEISVSLGIYLSQYNKSSFKDAFITFSESPKLQYLKGDLKQKYEQLESAEWNMSTNLESVFNLVLGVAKRNKLTNDDIPTHIIIISDMEFNEACRGGTAMDMIRKKFSKAGLLCPNVIFWNVNSRGSNVPVRFDENGTGLVSGSSPSVIKAVLGGSINPVDILMRAIDNPKYDNFIK